MTRLELEQALSTGSIVGASWYLGCSVRTVRRALDRYPDLWSELPSASERIAAGQRTRHAAAGAEGRAELARVRAAGRWNRTERMSEKVNL